MRGTALRWLAVLGVGAALLAVVLFFASTVDGRAPQVTGYRLTQSLSSDPGVALTTTGVEVVFSEPVDRAAAEEAFAIEPGVPGTFSWAASTMLFTPQDPLPLETGFEVSVLPGIRDASGNRMEEAADRFAFRTVGAPRVVAVDPADGAAGVARDAKLTVTFSTLMDTATVEGALRLEPEAEVRLSWAQEVLQVVPVEPLRPDRRYTLVITREASDGTGTPLESRSRTVFTTVASGLSVERVVPTDGSHGVAVRTGIAVEVDGEIDRDSLGEVVVRVTPEVPGSLEIEETFDGADPTDAPRRLLRFEPSGPLPPTTTFTVELRPGLRSVDGRLLARPVTWSFTTGAPRATLANQVLFLSDRAGVTNVWAMNPDGSGEHQVSSELSPVTDFAVAPDGRSVVVGDGVRLVRQRADGGDRSVLTEPGLVEFDPAFAPDGTALAFGRADAATGAGLGIWLRDGTAAVADRIDVATRPGADAESATPAPPPERSPLARAPRYAPDGSALAWIDGAGAIVVLELRSGERRRVPFVAASPPTWLADGRSLVVSGRAAPSGPVAAPPPPTLPIAPLDADAAGDDLRLVRLFRGASSVAPLPFGRGAARPAAGPEGAIVFVRLHGSAVAGELWRTNRSLGSASPALPDGVGVVSAVFSAEPGTLVFERAPDGRERGGIWLLDEGGGGLTPLSDDGSRPRSLP